MVRGFTGALGVVAVLLAAAALTGCTSQDEFRFSEGEIAVMLGDRLAPMPGPEAIDDPTNAYDTDPAAALLGQKLFYDNCYSAAAVSCATCHIPEAGFQWPPADGNRTSPKTHQFVGLAPKATPNSAQTLLNSAWGGVNEGGYPNWQFWDGRRDNQWAQAMFPPEHPHLMGSSRGLIAATVKNHYLDEYQAVFGPFPMFENEAAAFALEAQGHTDAGKSYLENEVTENDRDALIEVWVNFGKAIAAYERLIISRDSRFDRFLEDIADDPTLASTWLSESEKRGLRVFMGKANCIGCHNGPALSDGLFHNIGIDDNQDDIGATAESAQGREKGIATFESTFDVFSCSSLTHSDALDPSICETVPAVDRYDRGAHQTPTLRGLLASGPYMHKGTFDTLEEVVEFYNRGGDQRGFPGTKDPLIQPLGLTTAEKRDLVAFLGSLEGAPLAPELMRPPPGTCSACDFDNGVPDWQGGNKARLCNALFDGQAEANPCDQQPATECRPLSSE